MRNGYILALGLILLGLWGYFFTGTSSVTALIPAFFGIAIIVALMLGGASRGPIIAVVLAVLGAGGALSRAIPALSKASEEGTDVGQGPIAQVLMAIFCLVYVISYFFGRRKAA